MGYSLGTEIAVELTAEEIATAAVISAEGSAIISADVLTNAAAWQAAGQLAANLAINVGIGFAYGALFGGGSQPVGAARAGGTLQNMAGSTEPIPVVYGRRRVGGAKFLRELSGTLSPTGQYVRNEFLHIAIALSEGPIEAIDQIYLNDEPITSPKFANSSSILYCNRHLGEDSQSADADLLANLPGLWTANHRGAGIAYIAIGLRWDIRFFPTGEPVITADVRGRKLYDGADGGTRFSNNPAWVVRDYLTNTRYGWGIPAAKINDASSLAVANHAFERITAPSFASAFTADAATDELTVPDVCIFWLGDGVRVSSTGTLPGGLAAATTYYWIPTGEKTGKVATSHANALAGVAINLADAGSGVHTATHYDLPRYTCDGQLIPDNGRVSNAQELLSTMFNGKVVPSGAQYRMHVDKAETPTAFAFTEDNMTGVWRIVGPDKRSRYNRVKALYFDPTKRWDATYVPYDNPAWRSAEDAGVLLEADISLPYTARRYGAQQLAQLFAKQSRFGLSPSFGAIQEGARAEVGDVIPITHSTPGWAAKSFRVQRMELLYLDEVKIEARDYQASVYTLDAQDPIAVSPASNLPNPLEVSPPGTPEIIESIYETTGSAGVKSKAVASWGAAPDAFVQRGGFYELEYKLSSAATWQRISPITATTIELPDLAPDMYDFRVSATSAMGVRSDYSPTRTQQIVGLTAPPADVANFSVRVVSGQALAILDQSVDLDVRIGGRLLLRWSPLTVGAGWNDGSLLSDEGWPGDSVAVFAPLLPGTYLAKFQDSSGNYSAVAASFVLTDAHMTGFSALATATEHAAFSGVKINVAVADGGLQLVGSTLWDSIPDLDAATSIDSLGGIVSAGTYTFANRIDLGSVLTVKLFPNVKSLAFETADLWDDRTDPIDTWGLIDGSVIEDADVRLEVRTTDDDPAGSPTWRAWHPLPGQADYTARAFEFRLQFTSGSVTHNRRVTELSVSAKQST